jgi:hypothetical protein
MEIRLRAGTVIGRDHILAGKNRQDAFRIAKLESEGQTLYAGILSDGCGSMPNSEVGANLIAEFLISELLSGPTCSLKARVSLAMIHLQHFLRSLSFNFRPSEEFVSQHLLATVLGFLTDGEEMLVFSKGDGQIYWANEQLVIDENNTPDYVAYKAVGALRLPDGSWQPVMATKEIDLSVIQEELFEANLKKGRDWANDPKKSEWLHGATPEAWAEAQTKSNMIQWRKNKLMRAETGAMLRVIRAALGMKAQYTEAELRKPFIVPRIDFSPDYNDSEVRRALIDNGTQGMAKLYGSSVPAGPALAGGDAFSGAHPALVAGSDVDDEVQFDPADLGGTGEVEMPPAEPLQEAAQPTAHQSAETGAVLEAICSRCGAGVTEKVRKYSQDKFGAVLCYPCQNGGGQA